MLVLAASAVSAQAVPTGTSAGTTGTTTTGTTTGVTTTSATAGGGHTPVTLCHLEGNGSFHEITVDDDAVPAHLAHGDVLAGAAGCATTTTTTAATTTTTETATAGESTTGGQAAPGCAFGNERKNGQTATAPGCDQGGGNAGNDGNGGGGGGKKKGR